MIRRTVVGFALFLLGVVGGMLATSSAQGLRLEVSTGVTKHHLAPDGSWRYKDFETDMKLLVGSFQLGLLWTPFKVGDTYIGGRIGYANLGRIHASNSFPVYEDRSARDARINPTCDHATLYGCTGRFDGVGETKGFYIGPAIERDFGGGVALGLEAGVLGYESYWFVSNLRVVDGAQEFTPPMWGQNFTWNSARGYHATPYLGANARWHNVFIAGRVYSSVHAAHTSGHPDNVGPTDGPVYSVMFGYAWRFL